MFKEVEERGFDKEAKRRLLFRLDFIIKGIHTRQEVLKNGNLASLEPELLQNNQLFEDMADSLKELVLLMETKSDGTRLDQPS